MKQYFESRQRHYLQNKPMVFIELLRFLPINRLKSLPLFQELKKATQQAYSAQDIFSKVGISLVQYDELEKLKFLMEECGYLELPKCADENGLTLLHEACLYDLEDISRYLVNHRANINKQSVDGLTPLHSVVRARGARSHIEMLCDRGADLNTLENNGLSALLIAAFEKNSPAIELLKRRGANTKLTHNGMDYQAAFLAAKSGKITIQSNHSGIKKKTISISSEQLQSEFITFISHTDVQLTLISKYLEKRFSAKIEIKSHEINHIGDAFIFAYWDDVNKVIDKLSIEYKKQKISATQKAFLLNYLGAQYIKCNLHKTARIIQDYALEFLNTSGGKVNNIGGQYNQIAANMNLIQCYDISLLAINKGLEAETTDKVILSCLYYNLGMVHKFSIRPKDAQLNFEKSYELNNSDTEILQQYVVSLIQLQQYSTAVLVCQNAPASDLRSLLLIHARYLKGELDISELNFDESKFTNHAVLCYAVELKYQYHFKNSQFDQAILLAKKRLALILDQEDLKIDMGPDIINYLSSFVECGYVKEALQELQRLTDVYAWIFEDNLYLKYIACVIYASNNMTHDLKKNLDYLLEKNPNNLDLIPIITSLALQLSIINELDLSLQYCDSALKIDPENESALYLKYLLLKNLHYRNKSQNSTGELDDDFVNYVNNQNGLGADSEEKSDLISNDPKKFHEAMQKIKVQNIKNAASKYRVSNTVTESWFITETQFYNTEQIRMVSFNSIFFPNHFAIIKSNLKLERALELKFVQALMSNICKKSTKNGIKFIRGKLFELKINDDLRLYTTKMYCNDNGKFLVVFDEIGNHPTIERLVRDTKEIEIIKVSSKPDLRSNNSTNFINSKAEKMDKDNGSTASVNEAKFG